MGWISIEERERGIFVLVSLGDDGEGEGREGRKEDAGLVLSYFISLPPFACLPSSSLTSRRDQGCQLPWKVDANDSWIING